MREVAKKWYCVQQQFNLDGTIRQEDVEEYKEGMSYAGCYDLAYEISSF